MHDPSSKKRGHLGKLPRRFARFSQSNSGRSRPLPRATDRRTAVSSGRRVRLVFPDSEVILSHVSFEVAQPGWVQLAGRVGAVQRLPERRDTQHPHASCGGLSLIGSTIAHAQSFADFGELPRRCFSRGLAARPTVARQPLEGSSSGVRVPAVEHVANSRSQFHVGKRLGHELDAGLDPASVKKRVARVARRKQHLQVG